ncbi:hypothetical protein T01_421 [Trichinella spiralis]|uniref:Uncharacterized protein n=1 Tax=Trichinella spiralis TaxID=6334 RepID=A0A0V1BXB5_TRISP|nr:hypothetical protein T01_421 [Trichinella spiralis]
MLLTAILVVIVLALVYHFVTQKKQISDWKGTQDQAMAAIPEKKTPEEIIMESKEKQLKADKKQVGKTKKKTKSKKSKKAIKSIPKRRDISKEKSETKKEIEMAESLPETISAVAVTRNTKLQTQVTPFELQNTAQISEKQNIMGQVVAQSDFKQLTKVAEKIKKADSKKRKSKSAKRSKSTETKKEKTEMMVEKDTSSRKHKSKLEEEIMQWTKEVKAQATESNRLIDRMSTTRLSEKEKKAAERIGEEESRKEKKKSKKKSKSNKSKKGETEVTVKQHMNKQTHQTEKAVMEAPTTTEITAAVSDETVVVQAVTVEKKVDEFIKEVQTIEKEDSTQLKKKTKKRTKSKKGKKSDEDSVAKKAVSPQMPETDITSPKLTLAGEATAIDIDQANIVQPIAEEKVEKPAIKDEPKGEKKDSKKIKKKSKKRTKSKKGKKSDELKLKKLGLLRCLKRNAWKGKAIVQLRF